MFDFRLRGRIKKKLKNFSNSAEIKYELKKNK